VVVEYQPRIVDQLVTDLIAAFPAVSLVGPRASGKTTTALQHAQTILRLDNSAEAGAVQADPDAYLRGLPEPVLIDEWQEVPEVLGAVKRTVDLDPRPGRFLLTGSVRAELHSRIWPGTGRVIHVPMTTLSVREQRGGALGPTFIDRVLTTGAADLTVPTKPLDLRDYLGLALTSGFPEPALRLPEWARRTWLDGYVHQLVTRDAETISAGRDPVRMRRFLEVLALNTSGVVDSKTLYEAAGINRATAEAYESLMQSLFVAEAVPAWFTNRLKRLVKMPKRYIVDAALAASAMNADDEAILRDVGLLGRLVDTFVAAQVRAELPAAGSRPRMYHLRTESRRQEVDLLLEASGGRVVAIEVKASAAVDRAGARHLVWLRDELGERFVHGLVLHTGPRLFALDERITAAPISTLWS